MFSSKLSQLALPLKIKPGGGLKASGLRTARFMNGALQGPRTDHQSSNWSNLSPILVIQPLLTKRE